MRISDWSSDVCSSDLAARGVDVQVNVFLGIFGLEEQHLRDDQVGHVVFDLADHENHPLLEESGINVIGALTASGLLDHHRDQATGGLNVRSLHKRIAG